MCGVCVCTVEELVEKLTEFAEDSYESANSSYAEEEWWPVVAGVRSSLQAGDDGITLVGDAMDDLRMIYNDTEWWPVSVVIIAIYHFVAVRSHTIAPKWEADQVAEVSLCLHLSIDRPQWLYSGG